jgi:hypothetical protein
MRTQSLIGSIHYRGEVADEGMVSGDLLAQVAKCLPIPAG